MHHVGDQILVGGRTFLVADERCELSEREPEYGLFVDDVRVMRTWRVRIDGKQPEPLGAPWGTARERRAHLRHVGSDDNAAGTLLVERLCVVASGMVERIRLTNCTTQQRSVELSIEAATDFADLFHVKEATFARADSDVGIALAEDATGATAAAAHEVDGGVAFSAHDSALSVQVTALPPAQWNGQALLWQLTLGPRETATIELCIARDVSSLATTSFAEVRAGVREAAAGWHAGFPGLSGASDSVSRTLERSINDLGTLMVPGDSDGDIVPVAGVPWFAAVFGRDSLITSMQLLPWRSDVARGTLRYLAARQATVDDARSDAEPGKILHEIRSGPLADRGWPATYFGTVDATPLFAMLLSEYWQWTGDDDVAHELWPHLVAACEWMEARIDETPLGTVSYLRRAPHGLDNQSWKDSWDSQRHSDGRLATGRISPLEAQAYTWRGLAAAANLADALDVDATAAERWRTRATTLRATTFTRFAHADGGYVMALDGDGQAVDARTSNIGHVLWCGDVDEADARRIRDALMGDDMLSGWGVRTMSIDAAGANELSYHCGTVWPHDTAIVAAGLAQAGYADDAEAIALALFEAADAFNGRLPEVFAGITRRPDAPPVEYPTACSPQAWAAGTPFMLLRALLGLDVDANGNLVCATTAPAWLAGLTIDELCVRNTLWTLQVERDGSVTCAQLVPAH